MRVLLLGVLCLMLCSVVGCKLDNKDVLNAQNIESEFQKLLITAKPGQTFHLPEGKFAFNRSLSLNDTPGISIIGAGKGKTILDFKGQIEGAEGILIKNVKDLKLIGFTVSDSKGDAIKVQGCTNVTMRDLETTWTGGQLATNGAYGLYPVSSTNVIMEDCEASYAMDAGIYVGQSTNVVVRNNYVHHNVAGLEIENTINGEVYGNRAIGNTCGMLIFDMPDLPQANGDRIKFYDNFMEANNSLNFAPKGMIVSTLPPGGGMYIMSHSNIDVSNNVIKDHNTFGIAVNSWLITGNPFESPEFDPYSTNIDVHNNQISGGNNLMDNTSEFGQLLTFALDGQYYDIIIDGLFKPDSEVEGRPTSYCFADNGEVTFVNLQMSLGTGPADIKRNKTHDMSSFDCSIPDFDTEDHDAWLAID